MKTLSLFTIISLLASILFSIVLFSHDALYVIGGRYVLRRGETFEGDLNIIFAQVVLEEGARVNGHVFALSSDLDVRGLIEKKVLAVESRLDLDGKLPEGEGHHELNLFGCVILLPEMNRTQINH